MRRRSEPSKLPSVELDQWLIENGAAHHLRNDRACFHIMAGLPALGKPSETVYGCEGDGCRIFGHIFDHARRFQVKGSKRISAYAGVISAPYLNGHEMIEDAERIASKFGLAYRIGDRRDNWYGAGSTPIVIWNPDKISL